MTSSRSGLYFFFSAKKVHKKTPNPKNSLNHEYIGLACNDFTALPLPDFILSLNTTGLPAHKIRPDPQFRQFWLGWDTLIYTFTFEKLMKIRICFQTFRSSSVFHIISKVLPF